MILAGSRDRANVSARATGFVDGLAGGGVDKRDVRIINCEVSRQGGYDAASRLIAGGLGETDAIVCANDVIAIGALSACRAAGIDVPGRVSVTGFDDIQLAVDVTPRLTTVALPLAEIGAESIRLALAAGTPAPTDPALPEGTVSATPASGGITRELVRGTLVVRDSMAPRARRTAYGTRPGRADLG